MFGVSMWSGLKSVRSEKIKMLQQQVMTRGKLLEANDDDLSKQTF